MPEEVGRDTVTGITSLVSGVVLFLFALNRSRSMHMESFLALVFLLGVYMVSFVLIYGGFSEGFGRYNRHVAYGGMLIVLLFAGVTAAPTLSENAYKGDSITFTRYSVDLLMQGDNPYNASMLDSFEHVQNAESVGVTPRIDGSRVDTFSYPAMTLYAFVPQVALGIPNIRLTVLVALAGVWFLLFYESPDFLVLAPFTFLFVAPKVLNASVSGFTGALWLLPMLISMKYWKSGRLKLSMVALGVSFAVKQIPWFVSFYLAAWLWKESGSLEEYARKLATPVLYGGGTFFLLNAPFILMGPMDWVRGVLDPMALGASLVSGGLGLTMLGQITLVSVPKQFFVFAMAGFILVSLLVYGLYFDELKWMAWIMPGIVMWFNYRFYPNYFVYFIPAAYYAYLLGTGLERDGRWLY